MTKIHIKSQEENRAASKTLETYANHCQIATIKIITNT